MKKPPGSAGGFRDSCALLPRASAHPLAACSEKEKAEKKEARKKHERTRGGVLRRHGQDELLGWNPRQAHLR